MSFITPVRIIALRNTSFAILLAVTVKVGAGATPCLPATWTGLEANRVIYQAFPSNGPAETGWLVVWSEFGNKGLWIEDAWFYPPGGSGIHVLGRSGLSNIFVPYHLGAKRPYDLNNYGYLREAMLSYLGPCGTISGPPLASSSWFPIPIPPRPVLVKEIRDRGVAWTSDGRTRRGEELLLWSVWETGNYEYIIQYGFRDDGTITFRLGSTGYNSPQTPYEPHMHDALWYVDINLGQADRNSVAVMKHSEPATAPIPPANPLYQATDTMTPFNNGSEGFLDWNAGEFTCLNIMNTVTMNARGHNISYDLMPMFAGTARHFEDFFQHDCWVTKHPPSNVAELDYTSLPSYISPPDSIADTDIVVWVMSSNHHSPRDEDHEFDSAAALIQGGGIAQVMWSGFDLHPRNLMGNAPLHGCAPVPQGIVGWWPFEQYQVGTTVVADIKAVGPPNNGTPHPGPLGPNGPTPVVAGPGTFGLSFDGVDDYVEINDSASLNFGTGDLSVDFWIKTSPGPQTGVVLDKRVRTGNKYKGYHVFLSEGKPGIQLANGVGFNNYIATVGVSDGLWHHVAVTVNRMGGVHEIRWFLDGNLVNSIPAPLSGSLTNASPLRFGARSQSPINGFLKGTLGELEMFNRALYPSEVQAIYAAGKCR
jgi:primary-amine oxidase